MKCVEDRRDADILRQKWHRNFWHIVMGDQPCRESKPPNTGCCRLCQSLLEKAWHCELHHCQKRPAHLFPVSEQHMQLVHLWSTCFRCRSIQVTSEALLGVCVCVLPGTLPSHMSRVTWLTASESGLSGVVYSLASYREALALPGLKTFHAGRETLTENFFLSHAVSTAPVTSPSA